MFLQKSPIFMRKRAPYLFSHVPCFMAPRHVMIQHTCVLCERDLALRKRDLSFCKRATYSCAMAPHDVIIQHTRVLYGTQWRHWISVDQCRWPTPYGPNMGLFCREICLFLRRGGALFRSTISVNDPLRTRLVRTGDGISRLQPGVACRNGTCVCKTMIYRTAATHCNTLQHAATRCNTLQHAATRCNTLHQ